MKKLLLAMTALSASILFIGGCVTIDRESTAYYTTVQVTAAAVTTAAIRTNPDLEIWFVQAADALATVDAAEVPSSEWLTLYLDELLGADTSHKASLVVGLLAPVFDRYFDPGKNEGMVLDMLERGIRAGILFGSEETYPAGAPPPDIR